MNVHNDVAAAITIAAGSQVTFDDSLDASAAVPKSRTLVYHVQEGATLNLHHILSESAHDVVTITFYCAERSTVNYTVSITGAATTNLSVACYLQGTYAQATIKGAYALNGKQSVTISTLQEHQAEHTTSDLNFKGALNGQAQMHYDGMIMVAHEAQDTNAAQNNHTLLLSDTAHARSVPSLQVLTHDVQCAHGSAVGQLDEQQILYLRSRGLDEEHAKKILLAGFFADVVEDEDMLKEMLRKLS